MSSFINDGSLIAFFPLGEPSGASFFTNHSPARAKHPSGISFDLHVATSTTAAALDHARSKSLWPGTTQIFNASSGTTHQGYMVQGYWKFGSDSSPYSRYLVLGNGSVQTREQTLSQNVANSGITVGAWIYPNSDGYIAFATDANLATYNWETESARCHSLLGQFLWNNANGGWHLGVSGKLSGGAQFNSTQFGGPHQLAAYISLESNSSTVPLSLRAPIESGRYTHISFTYKFVNGTANVIVLYKDGQPVATGTTSVELDLSNTSILSRAFGIGNSDDAGAGVNNYSGTSGWNHLVSGVYLFRRVLSDNEALTLHNEGGLPPQPDNRLPTKEVLITDSQLLAYYPFKSIGYADATKNHKPLISTIDEGDADVYVVNPGPFNGGGLMQNAGTVNVSALVVSSGLLNDMLSSRSWTIGVFAGSAANNNGRDDNMIFSMGGVSSVTSTAAPTDNTSFNFGMALTEVGVNPNINRLRFSVYPLGNLVDNVYDIDIANSGYHSTSISHFAVAYDDQTRGIAAYLNGILQGSGILPFSLTDHLIKVAGSGYPLMFTNGVQDTINDTTARGLFNNGGNKMWLGPIIIAGRPLQPSEIRYVAQSGINISSLYRTIYDTRLMGYWPCTNFSLDDVIVEDKARIWNAFPGNLLRGDTSAKWDRAYTDPYKYDLFGNRTLPTVLTSYGNLGITSGVFAVHGSSPGVNVVTDALGLRSSLSNFSTRYKPVNEESDLIPQNILGEYIVSYEVTPSGNIPNTLLGSTSDTEKFDFNSTLHVYGGIAGTISPTNVGELRSFLTTIDASAGSGVTIVFQGRESDFAASAFKPLVSGRIPFGIPSKILFHSKFDSPYNVSNEIAGESKVTSTLWINGQKIQSVTLASNVAKIWTSQAPNSSNETWTLSFGGEIGNAILATQVLRDGGLGEIYMREMFVMRGIFEEDEVRALAVSGIQAPSIVGYTDSITTSQVTIADEHIEGYWRFNGVVGGLSGINDLSFKNNHLTPIAQTRIAAGGANQTTRAWSLIPGPLANSDLLVKCSGVSFTGTALVGAPFHPPFAVSGEAFNRPHAGFSVGFLLVKRNDIVTATTADMILSYGLLGSNSVSDITVNLDRGWAILCDDNNDMKMVLSTGGNGFYDNTSDAAQSGQLVCGTYEASSIYEDLTSFGNHLAGNPRPSRLDSWVHYCWVFDPVLSQLICYVNGNEIDRKALKRDVDPYFGSLSGLGPSVPANHGARMITFLNHQNSAPWDFNTNTLNDQNSIITDVFYFSRALTQAEVRYVAFNGIDDIQVNTVSGIIGGFIWGKDSASGVIGGYIRGFDNASGLIGGLMVGGDQASGIVGGYVRGFNTISGIAGGYVLGASIGSGLIGGLVTGADSLSGIVGGFIIGCLLGRMEFDSTFTVQGIASENFDSQIEIAKTANADFDAKIIIFQDEAQPLIDIIVPGTDISAGNNVPFNQYFVARASGTQGKTVVSNYWTFGDFSPPVSVAESGAGYFPISHTFISSGVYSVKFSIVDSDGMHNSAIRIINLAAGITPVNVALSGVPRQGAAALTVDFTTFTEDAPTGVFIVNSLLDFDDGQRTTAFNPVHVYTEPGIMRPVWIVRDSRGIIWSDTLTHGANQ